MVASLRQLFLRYNFSKFRDPKLTGKRLLKLCVRSSSRTNSNSTNHRTCCSSTSNYISGGVIRSQYPDVDIPDVTINELLLSKIEKWPDCIAVECASSGKKYTYNQLQVLSRRFAASLQKQGFRPGNVISILLPNVPDYAVVVLGALQAGMILSPLNPIYTPYELIHPFTDNGAVAVVTSIDILPKVDHVQQEIESKTNTVHPIKKIVLKLHPEDQLPLGSLDYRDMISENMNDCQVHSSRLPDDVAIFSYSSGTTGLPKAVQLTHKNIVSNIIQTGDNSGFNYLRSTTSDFQERLVAYLPFYHAFGLAVILMRSIFHGCRVRTLAKFDREKITTLLQEYRPTVLHMVPPVLLWLGSCESVTADHLASVERIVCGGAPHKPTDNEAVLAKSKSGIQIFQIYGATETGPLAILTPVNTSDFSALIPISNTTVKIVKLDGALARTHEEGEICIKGPQVMKGYLNKPDATKDAIDDEGFFHTGDVGMYNEESVFTVTDRIKELIKVRGFQVSPAELEAVLRSHASVSDTAVIGVPDEQSGEKPLAFVVRKNNVEEESLKNFVAQKVSPYKRLSQILFVDSIPKNPTGKILRRVLKDEFIVQSGSKKV